MASPILISVDSLPIDSAIARVVATHVAIRTNNRSVAVSAVTAIHVETSIPSKIKPEYNENLSIHMKL